MPDRSRTSRKNAPAIVPASPRRAVLAPRDVFIHRVQRGASYALALVAVTLVIGMVGYHLFEHLEHHRERLGGVRLAGGFVVDLTRIDVLGGAGTRVLDQLVVEARERGIDVEMVVRPGSTTERVLRLVGLGCHVRGDQVEGGGTRQ